MIVAWAREIAEEWRWLFASASLPALTPETFNATVLEDESNLWLVLFTDGMDSASASASASASDSGFP